MISQKSQKLIPHREEHHFVMNWDILVTTTITWLQMLSQTITI